MEEDFKVAFEKSSEAIEAIFIFGLSFLIFCGKKTIRGLEVCKENIQESSKWAIPGRTV